MSKRYPYADEPKDNHGTLKVGDKVRVAFRYDRLIVREISVSRFSGYRTIHCRFESGFGGFSGSEFYFVKGWKDGTV